MGSNAGGGGRAGRGAVAGGGGPAVGRVRVPERDLMPRERELAQRVDAATRELPRDWRVSMEEHGSGDRYSNVAITVPVRRGRRSPMDAEQRQRFSNQRQITTALGGRFSNVTIRETVTPRGRVATGSFWYRVRVTP